MHLIKTFLLFLYLFFKKVGIVGLFQEKVEKNRRLTKKQGKVVKEGLLVQNTQRDCKRHSTFDLSLMFFPSQDLWTGVSSIYILSSCISVRKSYRVCLLQSNLVSVMYYMTNLNTQLRSNFKISSNLFVAYNYTASFNDNPTMQRLQHSTIYLEILKLFLLQQL